MITYILLSGCSPFLGDDKQETFERILDIDYEFDDEIFAHVSDDAKDFIASILQRHPKSRPSAKKCLKVPWVNSGPDVMMPGTPVDLNCKSPDFKEKTDKSSTDDKKQETSRSSSSSLKMGKEKPVKPEKPAKPTKVNKKIIEEADKIDVEDLRSESRCQNDPFGVLPDGTGEIEPHELAPTPKTKRKIVHPLPVPTENRNRNVQSRKIVLFSLFFSIFFSQSTILKWTK